MPVSFPTSSFAEFSPNNLFAAGEPGVWFDPAEVADLKWRRNLLTYTEQFDNAAWAKYSSVTGSGLQVREIATNSEHYIEQIVSLSGSVTATFEVQSVGRDVIRLAIGTSSPIYGVLYTFSTGSLSSLGSAITEATATNLGDGYHRIVLKSNLGANRFRIALTDNGTSSYLGDVTKGINARKLQLEVGSTVTEYQRISDVHTEVRAFYPRSTLYQDTAGTQPVTTAGQSVALMLDKSRGLNWTQYPTTGWVKTEGDGVVTVTDNIITITGATTRTRVAPAPGNNRIFRAGLARLQCTYTNTGSAVGPLVYVAGVPATPVSGQSQVFLFFNGLNSGTDLVQLESGNATFVIEDYADNAGNHAFQSTAASRPIYSVIPQTGRRNLLQYTEQFTNSYWGKNGSITVVDNVGYSTVTVPNTIASSVNILYKQSITTIPVVAYRLDVRGPSGLSIRLQDDYGAQAVNFTGDWQTITFSTNSGGGFHQFYIQTNVNLQNYSFDIRYPQLEAGSTSTAYQRVVSQYDVTEAGVPTMHYLSFDGTDDFMVTPTITPGTDKVQVFAGVRKLSDAAVGTVVEHSDSADSNNGTFFLRAPQGVALPNYIWRSRGSAIANAISPSSYAAPITHVLRGIGDIGGDVSRLHLNGVQVAEELGDQGTGNFLAYPLYIGRRSGSSLPFNGHLYGLIVRFGANLPTARITQTERMLSRRTGFSAPQIDGTPTIGVTPL